MTAKKGVTMDEAVKQVADDLMTMTKREVGYCVDKLNHFERSFGDFEKAINEKLSSIETAPVEVKNLKEVVTEVVKEREGLMNDFIKGELQAIEAKILQSEQRIEKMCNEVMVKIGLS